MDTTTAQPAGTKRARAGRDSDLPDSPLYMMHHESARTLRYVLGVVQSIDAESAPKTPEAIAMMLRRGTDRLSIIRAFAKAYSQRERDVEAAARETKRRYIEFQRQKRETNLPNL